MNNGGILLFKSREMAVLPFSLKRKILRYMHLRPYLFRTLANSHAIMQTKVQGQGDIQSGNLFCKIILKKSAKHGTH